MDWKLTDLAAQEIAALEESGATVSPQDVLDIQRLSLLAIGAEDNGFDLSCGDPVSVGGVTLWPMTYAGAAFYRRNVSRFPGAAAATLSAYCLANGHDREAMSRGGREAADAVCAWLNGVAATPEQLAEAVNECLAPEPERLPAGRGDGREEPLPLIAQALCGGDPAMWETQCSIAYVRHVIRVAREVGGGRVDDRAAWLKALAARCSRLKEAARGE